MTPNLQSNLMYDLHEVVKNHKSVVGHLGFANFDSVLIVVVKTGQQFSINTL